jgi:hypothetical protein
VTFYIEHIEIELTEDAYGLTLKALKNEFPLPGQTIAEAKNTITGNFKIVSTKYQKSSPGIIPVEELNEVCLKVVLYYFYLYNLWRSIYENEKNRDLTFIPNDFTHPYTYDEIIRYFSDKYPEEYADKCAVMFEIKKEAVLKYEADRKNFYNFFR